MIAANEAREIVKKANSYYYSPEYPWDVLNDEIQRASNDRKNYYEYSERFLPHFHEHRKEVKQKLEQLGYEVEYRKFTEGDRDYQNTYNVYYIRWPEK